MQFRPLVALVGVLFVCGTAWVFIHTRDTNNQRLNGAFQFFAGMVALSCGILVSGAIIPYPEWFEVSIAISALVMSIQSVYLWVLRQCFNEMDTESLRVARLLNLGGQTSMLDQAVGSTHPDMLEGNDTPSQVLPRGGDSNT